MVDWPGLLKWTLKYSDGTVNKDIQPMDEETKKWLFEAIKEYTFNEIDKMKEILRKLNEEENPNDKEDENRRVELLDELSVLCEGIENAADMVRIGGFPILVNVMFNSKYDKVRKEAYLVFASCNQNNIFVQKASLVLGGFKLFNAVLGEKTLPNKEYAFTALSSLIRGENFESKRQFIDADGIELLVNVIFQNDNDCGKSLKIKTKASLLLNDLLYYDDKLDYEDMVAYNKSAGNTSTCNMHTASSKDNKPATVININPVEAKADGNNVVVEDNKEEEEKKSNQCWALGVKPTNVFQIEEKGLKSYKNIVKKKLIELDFINKTLKSCINGFSEDNLDQGMDFRLQYLTTVLTVLQREKNVKLGDDNKTHLKKFKEVLEAKNKQKSGLFDNEIEILRLLLTQK